MLKRWLDNRRLQTVGYRLYGAAVTQARDPYFYTDLGVEDTIDGRFDMICLHMFIMSRRLMDLGERGKTMQRAMQEGMVNDMDRSLREMGVGDLSVGKQVKKMGAAWFGRLASYDTASDAEDTLPAMTEAVRRYVFRGEDAPAAPRIAVYVLAAIDGLKSQADERFFDATLSFPAVSDLLKD